MTTKPFIGVDAYDPEIDGPPVIQARLTAGGETIAYFQRRHEAINAAKTLEVATAVGDRLIAAAPALLQWLAEYVEADLEYLATPGNVIGGHRSRMFDAARAAIAAATGEDK